MRTRLPRWRRGRDRQVSSAIDAGRNGLGGLVAEMDREPSDRWWLYATVFLALVTGATAGMVVSMIWAGL
jgi:hypothetical protein